MIRNATLSDCEPIAQALWNTWHQLKARQLATPLHMYPSAEIFAELIRHELSRWLVCESADPQQMGFFALATIGTDKTHKRWRFPERSVRIAHFPSLLRGEILLVHFQLLASHLQHESILLCVASELRDAYWAALKAGFALLGESPSMVGTFAWLYLDRENRHEEIQAKLRRAKIVVA